MFVYYFKQNIKQINRLFCNLMLSVWITSDIKIKLQRHRNYETLSQCSINPYP